jgi:predicted metal-dependent enzyme (double-stranded beta helix superfamily)
MNSSADLLQKGREWIANHQGFSQVYPDYRIWDLLQESYHFHRFLTEVEDVLRSRSAASRSQIEDSSQSEENYLPFIRKLVRKLIINSYWIQNQYPEPCQKTGVSLLNLYDEIGFPLTVQSVTFLPGFSSAIHNHGTWGVVAILKGQEKNTFWQQVYDPNLGTKIIPNGEITLIAGDIISFTPNAIHQIEAIANEPLVTFNIYGETQASQRFEFDPITQQRKKY